MAKKKKSFFFDFLNQICFHKKSEFYNDETAKDWNSFMIFRYLSMDQELLSFVNIIQPLQTNLEDRQIYDLLCAVIPKKKRFLKYVSGIKEETEESIKWVAKFYQCSKKEAQEYVEILGPSWANSIQKSFGEISVPKKISIS